MNNEQAVKLELKARLDLLKRLQFPMKQLHKAVEKETAERQKREKALLSYETLADAQEAYGYGEISQEEYDMIQESFEHMEDVVLGTVTPTSIAHGILYDFIRNLKSEVYDLEFETKSPEEQDRIRRESEERRERVNRR